MTSKNCLRKKSIETYPLHHGSDCGTPNPGKIPPWPKLKTLKNGLKNGSIGRLNETPDESLSTLLGFESPIVPDTTSRSAFGQRITLHFKNKAITLG